MKADLQTHLGVQHSALTIYVHVMNIPEVLLWNSICEPEGKQC